MKKHFLFGALCLLSVLIVRAGETEEIYTDFDSQTGTMTYYKDALRSSRKGITEVYTADINQQRFVGYRNQIKKIVIDESMGEYPYPESYAGLFFTGDVHNGLSALEEIENFPNLHFMGTDMSYMFHGCSALKTIDFSENTNLWTSDVKDMSYMFTSCYSLETLNINRFNTEELENMSYMFSECHALKSINLESFRTSKVKDMSSVFDECKSLTTLNIAHFDLSSTTVISGMFAVCDNLTTIYCNSDWSKLNVDADDVFINCYKLKGEKGTTYDEDKVDHSYARPDGGTTKPGYFTKVKEGYVVWNKAAQSLTYRYDNSRLTFSNTYLLPLEISNDQEAAFVAGIKTIEIDPSFKDYTDVNEDIFQNYGWTPLENVEEINGLEYLNTSEMTDMAGMFESMKVTTLDLTSFDVRKVEDFQSVFADCINLTTIYCNDDWTKIANPNPGWIDRTFKNCISLVGGKGTLFSSSNVDFDYARPDGDDGRPGYFTRTKPEQDIENIQTDRLSSHKIMCDGVLLIERNGRLFNAQGIAIR